jgi:hypothetical protein
MRNSLGHLAIAWRYNQGMPANGFRFSLSHLLIVVTYVAIVTASATFLPSAYYTEGAVGAGFIGLLFALFALGTSICLCFRRLRLATLVITLVICGLFVHHQSALNERLKQLELEIARIITHLDTFKASHNEFPHDLSGYEFQLPELEPYIAYRPPGTNGRKSYLIIYHPTTYQGIGHWYSGDGGYWFEDD